ncbi:MAG: VTT domain-containing protein [Candidatus Diapherotrites archaeon]|nr:VTT domain-containing protein [Candidatus Diapherotrites archaeon]
MRINWGYVAIGVIVIAAIIGGLIAVEHPQATKEWLKKWGYVGVFFAVLITNATLFIGIPTPTYILIAVALGMNPLLVSLISAIASAIGESTGYFVGLGSKKILERKYKGFYEKWGPLFEKYSFMTVLTIAALPVPPDDFAGLLAGSVGYSYPKFLLATFIGKFLKYGATAILAVAGIRIAGQEFS